MQETVSVTVIIESHLSVHYTSLTWLMMPRCNNGRLLTGTVIVMLRQSHMCTTLKTICKLYAPSHIMIEYCETQRSIFQGRILVKLLPLTNVQQQLRIVRSTPLKRFSKSPSNDKHPPPPLRETNKNHTGTGTGSLHKHPPTMNTPHPLDTTKTHGWETPQIHSHDVHPPPLGHHKNHPGRHLRYPTMSTPHPPGGTVDAKTTLGDSRNHPPIGPSHARQATT